jgi:hypothetical protein
MKVRILIIDHHNGRDLYPCTSFERAEQRLDQYVQKWWHSTRGQIASEYVDPTPGDPSSMTRERRIETFYNYWEGKRHEFWKIEKYEVLE